MRIKHLLTLKQYLKSPPWKNLTTHWLTIDIYNYSKDFQFLMDYSRTKTLNNKKPIYYQDIMCYIKNNNQEITKTKAETKTIYQKIIQDGSKQHAIAGEIQWKKHLPTIDFKQIWKNTFESYAQPFFNDLHYKLLHCSTKRNDYRHKCSSVNKPSCDHCGITEDNLHLFEKCSRIPKIWTPCQTILTKLIRKTYSPQRHLITLNVTNTNKLIRKLTLTIIQIILFEIWQSRNDNRYDKNLPQHIQTIVLVHYKKNYKTH